MRLTQALVPCLVALTLASPALAKAKAKPPTRMTETPVSVTDAWIREAPPGATAMAAYMLVVNLTKHEMALNKVTSPAFGEVQMHVSEAKDGMMRMKEVPGFSLAPNARLTFKPGGNHLMLLKPQKALKAGDQVAMTLWFGKDGHRSILVKVLQQGITSDTLQVPAKR